MFKINKVSADPVIDYAAEELKKYLRMMMPEGGDIIIAYASDSYNGFRLGLMQDLGLDTSDVQDTELDDIIYIECDENGGIISGDNPRSVLLAVYEYLRQNGCRWLYPGVDGEYIPMKNITPVSIRHKPSFRYRGWCNEGAESQKCMLETIDFAPKVGMNVYMLEFRIPTFYYDCYYDHTLNEENRTSEHVSKTQILQWKRQCEVEIAKRGLQFHDIGHGWTVDSFGIDSSAIWSKIDESKLSDESLAYMPEINGKRGLFNAQPINTQFCMSNTEARLKFVNYVADYIEAHSNSDYLHVWLADGRNNHCECPECKKMLPSDYYVILLNELDEELTSRNLDTRIVFVAYFDTLWAPRIEKIKNPKRFALLMGPITRDYTKTVSDDPSKTKIGEYVRNKNIYPEGLEEYLAHIYEWNKTPHGSNISYEYHFWVQQCFDVSGIYLAKRINEDIKAYKGYTFDGIIEDGSQRSAFPNGLAFYTYARTLYDSSLSSDYLIEDYFSHIYGEDWKLFREYLSKLAEAIPFDLLKIGLELMTPGNEEEKLSKLLNPDYTKKLLTVKSITSEGRKLIKEHYNSKIRVETVSVRLLEKHADFCEMISDALIERTLGNIEKALELFNKARIEFGKNEAYIETYFDHFLYFDSIRLIFSALSKKENKST